uniref:Cytochrome b n=1 Tax=Tachaea chinensis TaxID=1862870 RepID=A0A7L4XQ30_9CRUS|nr:cytochrome b [Tachaea chinensis]
MIWKKDPIIKAMDGLLVSLPSPSNLSSMWNFGSLLGLCLVVQIVSGIMLAVHYINFEVMSFYSVVHIMRDVNYGWVLRVVHMNGASFFFFCLYFHIGRGMYYGSYKYFHVWMVGVTILFVVMATAFLGYVLPWGQMSFWGATVITNLLSVIPLVGTNMVEWLWGGYSVGGVTLTRFFVFHFLFPFILTVLVIIHVIYLHETGSNNPLGINMEYSKVYFYPYFLVKDLVGFIVFLFLLFFISFVSPFFLGDPENFNVSDMLVTPIHIQPEWYYLFAYAILRSIPNKMGGVIALVVSIAILYIMPYIKNMKFSSMKFYKFNSVLFWFFIGVWLLLTWIGMCPVEPPFILIGQILTFVYFMYFLLSVVIAEFWDFLLN